MVFFRLRHVYTATLASRCTPTGQRRYTTGCPVLALSMPLPTPYTMEQETRTVLTVPPSTMTNGHTTRRCSSVPLLPWPTPAQPIRLPTHFGQVVLRKCGKTLKAFSSVHTAMHRMFCTSRIVRRHTVATPTNFPSRPTSQDGLFTLHNFSLLWLRVSTP